MILHKQFRFEASHRLPFHPGKCSRLHGHSWVLDVEVEGPVVPSTGFVMDFAFIKEVVDPVVDDLDHRHLGTWEALQVDDGLDDKIQAEWGVGWLPWNFNSTCENLLIEIAKRLGNFNWSSLSLHETCTSAAKLTKSEFIRLLSDQDYHRQLLVEKEKRDAKTPHR